jgi:hypothetical protein
MSSDVSTSSRKYYTSFTIKSWGQWQAYTPDYLHSIENYYDDCKKVAKDTPEDVMVLRDEVECITGWCVCAPGRPAQRCADIYGWVDVRTGKKYTTSGAFYEDIK